MTTVERIQSLADRLKVIKDTDFSNAPPETITRMVWLAEKLELACTDLERSVERSVL